MLRPREHKSEKIMKNRKALGWGGGSRVMVSISGEEGPDTPDNSYLWPGFVHTHARREGSGGAVFNVHVSQDIWSIQKLFLW